MPETNYLSEIEREDGTILTIKDAEARAAIDGMDPTLQQILQGVNDIKSSIGDVGEIVEEVLVGPPTLIEKTITANGTYAAEDDGADGYSSVTVDVSSGGTDVFLFEFTIETDVETGESIGVGDFEHLFQELHDAISQNRPIVRRSNMPESFDQGYINNQNIYYSGIEDLMNMAEISPEGLPIEDSCGFSGSYGYGDAETGDADGRLVSVSMYRNKQGYYEVTVDHTW